MFLKNTWYVGAESCELDAAPLGRTILGQPVVFYRPSAGAVTAIGGKCPHRFAPLHMGLQVGTAIRCPYHGLQFGPDGRCVNNPHPPGHIPDSLRVPSYPVMEMQGLVWIWMGDPARAAETPPPSFDCLDPKGHAVGYGYLYGRANYELMVDNIMDLSHVEFLHPGLGTEAVSRALIETKQVDGAVVCIRKMVDEVLPPQLARAYRTGERRVNRTFTVEWRAPALMRMTIAIDPADPAEPALNTGAEVLHLFTPETVSSSHYFYVSSRRYEVDNTELTRQFLGALGAAFANEDKPMIEAQQTMIGEADLMTLKPMLLPIDQAAVRVRRLLQAAIQAEAST